MEFINKKIHYYAGIGTIILGIGAVLALFGKNPNPVIAHEQITGQNIPQYMNEIEETVKDKDVLISNEAKDIILNGFVEDKKGTRYYRNNEYVKDAELAFGPNTIYSFDGDGYMRTGWHCDQTGFHFYRPNGVEKQEWVFDGKSWYYLEDGELYTGWHQIADRMLSKNTYWYCFDAGGRLYENTITPDGQYVDYDGKLMDHIPEEEKTEEVTWEKKSFKESQLSGYIISGKPVEFYMLSMAGETSGLQNVDAISQGDRGRAYGVCQFDYRYDLVGFMNYAYNLDPELWGGFKDYLNLNDGNALLVYNDTIGNTFIKAMRDNYTVALSDQLEYFRQLYWDGFQGKMDEYGFDLGNRHIAVSAALFSVNVNCGAQPDVFIKHLDPAMNDEDMIKGIYKLRNTVFAQQNVGDHVKGTSTRYTSAEPEMALDLLHGYMNINTNINYGGGVEWGGNVFLGPLN